VDAILRAIYQEDEVPEVVRGSELGAHIAVATTRQRVVPLALVLCRSPPAPGAVAAAEARLKASPVLRKLVMEL
jgi:hypothetical protein